MNIKTRDHSAVLGRTDTYKVNPTEVIIVDGWNPRSSFDATKLDELKESIKELGVIVPIRVKINNDGKMILIDGERRLRATLLAIADGADIVSIPAIVERKAMNEIDMMILAMTANTGEPLTMVEEAQAIKKLLAYGLTQKDIATKLGKSIATINNRIQLLDASPELLEELENNKVSFSDVKKIVKDSDGIESQKEALQQVKEKKAKRKASGVSKPGKKEFISLTQELVEWLVELNIENLTQVDDLISKANKLLDNQD